MTHLSNFHDNLHVVVIGASGGIGGAFVEQLANDSKVSKVYALSRSGQIFDHAKISSGSIDILDEGSIESAAENISADKAPDIVIVATGILHDDGLQPEKSLRDLDHDSFAKSFAVNASGPAMVAKHFLKTFDRDTKSVFAVVTGRVGSISDNVMGGWYAYRAAKAAAHMLMKNAAIEMGRRYKHNIILSLQPGTVDTDLSKPFQGNVKEGKLFTPEYSAISMLKVINDAKPENSGNLFAWDGEEIPF